MKTIVLYYYAFENEKIDSEHQPGREVVMWIGLALQESWSQNRPNKMFRSKH